MNQPPGGDPQVWKRPQVCPMAPLGREERPLPQEIFRNVASDGRWQSNDKFDQSRRRERKRDREREREREREKRRKAWGGLGFSSNASKRPEEVSALLM
jgi:hypothetical protein